MIYLLDPNLSFRVERLAGWAIERAILSLHDCGLYHDLSSPGCCVVCPRKEKPWGSSSSTVISSLPWPFSGAAAMMTRAPGASSDITWRHTPQGLVGSGSSATTAMASKLPGCSPAAMAVPRATRSAQMVGVYEPFSMLQPV